MVIASAEGLSQTVKLRAETDNYFQSIQALISTHALCQQVTDLPALMRTVHTKLNESPMPLEIPNKDGTTTKMLFQVHHMRVLAGMLIADPGQYLAMLIQIYRELNRGETVTLSNLLQRGFFKIENHRPTSQYGTSRLYAELPHALLG